MRLYKGNLKNKISNSPTGKLLFVMAEDEKDAERIMNNNLDTRQLRISDVVKADMLEIDEKSITIGFRHPMVR